MKQLRVLTGFHAGTQISLSASVLRISADTEADLQITDWSEPEAVLTLSVENDMHSATLQLTDSPASILLEDFAAHRFGNVVLCLGPDAAPWPNDIDLLERLMRPAAKAAAAAAAAEPAGAAAAAAAAPHRRGPAAYAGIGLAAAVSLLVTFYFVASHSADAAARRVPPLSVFAQVSQAVQQASSSGMTVHRSGDRVVVEGLLETAAEVVRVRQALAGFPDGTVEHRYAAASEVAQSIADTLSAPNVQVSYLSQGEFKVSGKAMQLDRLRAAAGRVAADLAPLVRAIHIDVVELPTPPKMPVGAMLSADGIEYVQARDGSKFLSILPAPITELQDSIEANHR